MDAAMPRRRPEKWWEKMVAGMAANRPTAVAISASAMPGATTARLADPARPMPSKALMMPTTVPNSPMKGAALPVVARKEKPRSRRSPSRLLDQLTLRASSTRCGSVSVTGPPLLRARRRSSLYAARKTAASGLLSRSFAAE
jgi:hypothetical protein